CVADLVTVVVVVALFRRLCRCVDDVVVLLLLMVVVDDDAEIVPLTYHLGDDIEIQFGRKEFCLETELRFGVDYSSLYSKGLIPFRRRVFDSARDGHRITAKMLEDKIKIKQFFTIKDKDAVSLCLLAILELVLLGQEPRHNVPEWCLRLGIMSRNGIQFNNDKCAFLLTLIILINDSIVYHLKFYTTYDMN
ncbi:hypothetical protein Tco_0921729, partial [Tanacetum coccineum]